MIRGISDAIKLDSNFSYGIEEVGITFGIACAQLRARREITLPMKVRIVKANARPLPATRNPGRRAVRREPLGAEFRLNWRSQALGLSSRRPGPLRPSPGPQEARPPYHSIFHSGSEAMGERGARRQQSVWEENSVKDLWKVDKSHVFNSEV